MNLSGYSARNSSLKDLLSDKGKPRAIGGRKATGQAKRLIAGLPKEEGHRGMGIFLENDKKGSPCSRPYRLAPPLNKFAFASPYSSLR